VTTLTRWLPFLFFLSAAASADDVYLQGAGKISGRIVERTATSVTIEVSSGKVTVPMARVARIEEKRSPLEEYEQRAARLSPGDAAGWMALGDWAAANDMNTKAREAYERAVAIAPNDPAANKALGNVQVDGRWATEEEAYRARGYVQFEGEWMTPAEQQRMLQERAADKAERARQDADRRARDAEQDRAREAEAQAKKAEEEAEGGMPLWWAWGPGPTYWPTTPVTRPARPATRPASVPR
jgi:colicin import membrane protein